jgi:hypothetical protein
MADQADVEAALVQLATKVLYPNGPDQGSALGPTFRIYRGWPQAAGLVADLAERCMNVSVFSIAGSQRIVPRFPDAWVRPAVPACLSATTTEDTVTFAGTPSPGEVVGVLADGTPYRYQTVIGDTAESVTEAIAELIRVIRPAFVLNASLWVPSAYRLVGRVVGSVRMTREVRRQEQRFRMTLWSPTPELRDDTAALVDVGVATTPFLKLPDGSAARLIYAGSETTDNDADATLYRRDILVDAEYPTTISEILPCVLFSDLNVNQVERLS